MATTITRSNLEARCENLNRRMEQAGSSTRYRVQSRNGATSIDRLIDNRMHGHVTAGTKREIGEFLHAMMTALDDARWNHAGASHAD